ncbi:AMP-binding protein [Falsigemmobacter faecalis]|uniref:3-methylmercaptopropionyl-CoA ligase n=1 Tax=Falsigemmobacter faecalis TaxID=2488730 RepID=A0A3P3DMQ7_9RHOB|nr:AMP-binding protein [Falsigemmobacter faecalis]RRH75503.1 acyl-CoA synthetase [Falsigemmobacter faecalis]
MGWLADERGLEKTRANYAPLTPLSWLRRAAAIWPDHEALVYGPRRQSYRDLYARVSRLASGLAARGVQPGDVVATLIPNLPAQVEAHFGVPACGAVLNAINTRLDVETVAYIFAHGGAKVVIADTAFLPLAEAACAAMTTRPPEIIEAADAHAGFPLTGRHGDYEDLLASGDPGFAWLMPADEWESLALNYTSGTTGRPKGVVYHHRGAALAAQGQVISWRMVLHPRYLTIVPLFHCNAWCHPWMMPLVGGTMICCRDITAGAIYAAIADEGVTHFGGAPIVLNTLINARDEERRSFPQTVEVFTAGAPPAAATLAAIEPLGFNVTQVYGLTETYGPATECTWQAGFEHLSEAERFAVKARTGVGMPFMEEVTVLGEADQPVPFDGVTLGEIAHRGNGVMKGYYKNPEATAEAFKGGWFRSGDIAFRHEDGYIKIADRAKDIIISGGENVSSVEVEGVLMAHPSVSLCAVVALPDDRWGEVPCAFVELKEGAVVDEAALIAHCRSRLAGFKTPKRVIFGDLPKTSTGKIQKFELRGRAKALAG